MIIAEFFRLGMRAPGRRVAFTWAVAAHLLVLLGGLKAYEWTGNPVLLGQFLLVAGIVEGATLIGWRLTQLPKSQALEFFLVSPLQPETFFLAEASVGLARVALVTLSSLPILVLCVAWGALEWIDLPVLLGLPFTWAAITGLGLTCWAYEPLQVRKIGERILFALVLVYLVVGVLAAENLPLWFSVLGLNVDKYWLQNVFRTFHYHVPFTVMMQWFAPDTLRDGSILAVFDRLIWLEGGSLVVLSLVFVRSAYRLKGHFHDRHYRPVLDPTERNRGQVGDRPLSWWAVRRVTEYSGRANLYIAVVFGVLFAAYTMFHDQWPLWLGRAVFETFKYTMGGIPVVAAALVVLAAVPAAFQYGLWDSNAQDRCRRLELLLLTDLGPRDYWEAALAAALRRGGGYFLVAVLLWTAAAVAANRLSPGDPEWVSLSQIVEAGAAGVILWGAYFAIGFRAFASGVQANGLGSLLTLGVPLIVFVLTQAGLPLLADLLPPGFVYSAVARSPGLFWPLGPILWGSAALLIARRALASCDADLRRWYDAHQGQRVSE